MADAKIEVKAKKPRAAQKPRPLFVVLSVLGTDGQPMEISKDRIQVLAVTRRADELLEALESGKYPNAVYKKVQTAA